MYACFMLSGDGQPGGAEHLSGLLPGPSAADVSDGPAYPEGPETGEDIPEAPKPLPSSISLSQGDQGGFLLWELHVEDDEELMLVESLLSTEDLVPFDEGEGMWPDGGSSIGFEICYEDAVITGACDPQYNGGILDKGYTRMRIHESGIFYRYPREIGDQLLEFLESKVIEVSC